MQQKQYLRKQYKQIRDALSADFRAEADLEICAHLATLELYKNAQTVMAYSSFGSEVGTGAIVRRAFLDAKTVLLPVTDLATETMHASVLTSQDALVCGGYGIYEPADTTPYSGKIDLVLLPGLVFNRNGARIGYGKGYYDKFLSLQTTAYKVGLAYQCQICGLAFGEPHDIRLDRIVTEKGGIVCGAE